MQNLCIFGSKLVFFILILLKEIRKSVCNFIGLGFSIINLKVIPKELLGSPDLIKAQVLYDHEPT